MKEFFKKSIDSVGAATEQAINELSNQYDLVKEKINNLPIFISSESTDKYGVEKYDEKHYFVVPYNLSKVKVVLHTMRCLPEGVPEINDLPKRRIFHFPNEYSEALVRKLLMDDARDEINNKHTDSEHSLAVLADYIDIVDKKLTYGMLVVGGFTAFLNPVIGALIAIKAVLPGVATVVNNYGLRPAGKVLSEYDLDRKLKESDSLILEQFQQSDTIEVINPILQELELALRTNENEHDPLIDFDLSSGSINQLDGERWRDLTYKALYHVYDDVLDDPDLYDDACLGVEDIRWFKVILDDLKYN